MDTFLDTQTASAVADVCGRAARQVGDSLSNATDFINKAR